MGSAYKTAKDVIREASEKYGLGTDYDMVELAWVQECCDTFDSIADEFEGEYFDSSVDPDSKELCLSLVCNGFSPVDEFDSRLHILMLTGHKTSFAYESDGKLRISNYRSGIWKNQEVEGKRND